ncbi:hypothetical protein FA95DRAFT_1611009 [Auriscalpium vulgare]|uniref:Uncharacterized protein n=1 Tax=Auriscalpium vulgare TaxID=40419 RepID=A0ACB8RBM4_9AGAM|nr:hypothetical protein FA95DRAFT_1611009 [Auriscalpium vulgare]
MATELPLDVQILVIECVFRSSQHARIDYTTLHACALVCRAWTPTAQRLLFRRLRCISLDDRQCNIQLVVDTLIIHPRLSAHVRYIQVSWPSFPPAYASVCLRLLELCPHVEGVSFLGWNNNNRGLTIELAARMRAIQLQPVLLKLLGLTKSKAIVDMFPGARLLVFSAGHGAPLPPTVESLEIVAAHASDCLTLSHPLPSLRHLCLVIPRWSDEALRQHLVSASCLPQRQSLSIRGDIPPAEMLEQLVQLKTLIVGELPRKPVSFPSSLRHFGYHAWVRAMKAVSMELAIDPLLALPELQLVTVTREFEPHVRAALEKMCRDKGLGFGTFETYECLQKIPKHSIREPAFRTSLLRLVATGPTPLSKRPAPPDAAPEPIRGGPSVHRQRAVRASCKAASARRYLAALDKQPPLVELAAVLTAPASYIRMCNTPIGRVAISLNVLEGLRIKSLSRST